MQVCSRSQSDAKDESCLPVKEMNGSCESGDNGTILAITYGAVEGPEILTKARSSGIVTDPVNCANDTTSLMWAKNS